MPREEWAVTVRQMIMVGQRRKLEPLDRQFFVQAKTRRGAVRAVRDAGHLGIGRELISIGRET